MYTIYIERLTFEAVVGLLDFEREKVQKVVADCEIRYEREGEIFVDYAKVADIIERMTVKGQYLLIEDALSEIIDEIKNRFSCIKSIKLKISKPDILANCTVSVEKTKNY